MTVRTSNDQADMNRSKVVIVAPVHPYYDVRVFQKEAKTLARAGYAVTLIAQAPKELTEDGVLVKPAPKASWRGARFCKLPLVFFKALRERADIYHLHNPDTLPIAVFLKLLGYRVVYDTHEDFSELILAKYWIPKAIRPFIANMVSTAEGMVARWVDKSIATENKTAQRLGDRCVIIENAPQTQGGVIEKAVDHAEKVSKDESCFRLVYIGNISRIRGLFSVLDALVLANKRYPVRLWLAGRFVRESEFVDAQRHQGWPFVDYLGLLPQWEAFSYVSKSDLGIVILLDVGNHRNANNNKIFEYIAMGIPFVATDFPKWKDKLDGVKAGWFVDPEDPRKIAEQICWCAENRLECRSAGARGREFVQNYNWEKESKKLLDIYGSLVQKNV